MLINSILCSGAFLRKCRVPAIAFSALFVSVKVVAQKTDSTAPSGKIMKDVVIEDVVITGQYSAGSRSNAVQKIDVINRKTIDAMAAQNLRDVLTNQLDIRLSYDPIFGTSMNMQGSRGYGADPKILIDGVPVVGKQNGSVDLAQINLANIERIEIITGPMSVSYGSDAVAGTVNLITKKAPAAAREANVTTYYEQIGTYNVQMHGGAKKGAHSIVFDGFRNFFDGWDPRHRTSFLRFAATPADSSRTHSWKPREQYNAGTQYIFRKGKVSVGYKGNYFYELITSRGVPQLPYMETAFDNRFHTRRIDNAINADANLKEGIRINAFLARNAYKRIKNEVLTDLTTLSESSDAASQDTSGYVETNSRGTVAGSSFGNRVKYEFGYDVNLQQANSTQIADRKQHVETYALFASSEIGLMNGLTVRPGLRYGYNSRFRSPVVPSVNFMYKPLPRIVFRWSYAKGFRQPGLKELYFDFVDVNHDVHGNTELRAEYSHNFSASAGYSVPFHDWEFRFNSSLFHNDIRDLITLTSVMGGSANEYTYTNVGRYRTKGVQAGVEVQRGLLSGVIGFSYNGVYNALVATNDMPMFIYSPEIRASVSAPIPRLKISGSVFYKYTGSVPVYMLAQSGETVLTEIPGYHTCDLTLSRRFVENRLGVSLGCKNLFDVRNISGAGQGAAHSGTTNVMAISTGRVYFLKVDLKVSSK